MSRPAGGSGTLRRHSRRFVTDPPSSPLPVTVVIPAYDRAELLPRALASVAAQTAAPAEILVIDDGSADDTAAVAERLGARVLRHERNRGVSAARNTALDAAGGEWVAFLDTDDEWLPFHLERLWPRRDGHAAALLRSTRGPRRAKLGARPNR